MSSDVPQEAVDELLHPFPDDGYLALEYYDMHDDAQYTSVNGITGFSYTPSTTMGFRLTSPTREPMVYYNQGFDVEEIGTPRDVSSNDPSMPPPLANLSTQSSALPISACLESLPSISRSAVVSTIKFGKLSETVSLDAADALQIPVSNATSTPLSPPPSNLIYSGQRLAEPYDQRLQPMLSLAPGYPENNSALSQSDAPGGVDPSRLYPSPSRTPKLDGMLSVVTGQMGSGQVGVGSLSASLFPATVASLTTQRKDQAPYSAPSYMLPHQSSKQPFASQGVVHDAQATLSMLPVDARQRLYLKPVRGPAPRVKPPQATGVVQAPEYSALPIANPVPRVAVAHHAFDNGFTFAIPSAMRLMAQHLYPSPSEPASISPRAESASTPPQRRPRRPRKQTAKKARSTVSKCIDADYELGEENMKSFACTFPTSFSPEGKVMSTCGVHIDQTELTNHFKTSHSELTAVDGKQKILCLWPGCHAGVHAIKASSMRNHAPMHFGIRKEKCHLCGATSARSIKRHMETHNLSLDDGNWVEMEGPPKKKQKAR